ncbi:hypothetical protein OUZ56_023025 [Daphnia magna]|uniref:Uncharacterized protein n=1 Tax=Daphnia magna TaxID=35525 RepID=A0ABR0AY98_9CRUS|nr:hypothetical protein OUZ56_023025 [Daphnia magna]
MKCIHALFAATQIVLFFFSAECEGNNKERKQMKAMTGVHLRIVAYHHLTCSRLKLKEPPIFSIIRNPANESLVRYVGFPKEVFNLLSNSMNFTSVSDLF